MAQSNTSTERSESLKKVAIVGGGPSRRRAPFSDPSWEIWAFSSRWYRYPRVTRWFELHSLIDLRQQLATRKPGRRSYGNYMRFMRQLDAPVYMQKKHPRMPNSEAYPIEEALAKFGRCFTSTASYMIALAIMEGYAVIGLWGIDVSRPEYIKQRPAIRYLLGVARQEGIKIRFARGHALRVPEKPRRITTRALYAYDWRSPYAWWRGRVRRRLRRQAKSTKRARS